ncbi:MAG: family 16 glycoside hydrolase [Saprospiraceae bacterium]
MNNRLLFILVLLGLAALWYFAGRHDRSYRAAADRPNDPWVFRSVLDKQARMITFALDDHLWVAYSTDSCSLYKAWEGGVDFTGAVYNMRHGPQPMSIGNAWFENAYRQPWTVTHNGKTETPRADYKGHRYTRDGHAEIMYDLVLSDGQRIRVNERPEYVERDRQRGFERTFTIENAPEGVEVSLHTNVASIADPVNIETDGAWKQEAVESLPTDDDLRAVTTKGELTLRSGKPTRFAAMFVHKALIPNPFDAERRVEEQENAVVSPGERLMAKSDCRTCHNPQVQTVGPGYVQIAERYKNTPENVEMLSEKVIKGGSGAWGVAAMSAHPDLQPEDAKAIVNYVLSFDEGEDDGEGGVKSSNLSDIPESSWLRAENDIDNAEMLPGLLTKIYSIKSPTSTLNSVNFNATPVETAVAGLVDAGPTEFSPYKENFALSLSGYLFLDKDDNVLLQLNSDDGSRLYLDGQLLIDNDGNHGMEPKEAEVALRGGYHALRIDYYQGGGGRGLQLKWARSDDPKFRVIPEVNFSHKRSDADRDLRKMAGTQIGIPGDGIPLTDVHPSYDLTQARPDEFLPKVAGMDFLPDGRLLVSTWDAMGAVYMLDNVSSGDPKKIKMKMIAKGLAEPLGLKVVGNDIFVLQKQELTKLIDRDGDDIIDEYQCFAKGWKASANFHEFAFGLAHKGDYLYAALATAIMPGGASARPQIVDRGKVVQISLKDGSIEFVARGLRTPDGVGLGPDGELFVADNQGDWLPSSKILHVRPGAFFGSFSVDSINVANLPVQPPVVWLPQDEIGNSPTQPAPLNDGPYKGQLIFGDVCYGGLQRTFVEKVNGEYQGCVFMFTQGLEGGTHRLAWGPDGAVYIGMIGNPGNWGQVGKFWYGLQRMKYNGASTFEMLAIRAKTNGIEIEFTEPLREGDGWNPKQFLVKQWWYKPTINYGGPKMDEEELAVRSASVSPDRKKVFLEVEGIQPGHVVYVRLRDLPLSDLGHEIWTTEGWYTMNAVPADNFGAVLPVPDAPGQPDNTLSSKEKAAGWQLLFDGKTTAGWHNYGKTGIGSSWTVDEGALHLDTRTANDGGDILTADEYQDFELSLEWKIAPCGNSGIIYNVVEDPDKYSQTWLTGPEMQVLDNACHPDSKFPKHRAGDLYDLIECKYVTVKPAGQWNRVRIISKNGKVEHWLNDRKLVEYDMNAPSWGKLIAGSKFKDMPGFGKAKKGKIALQDHGDPVWYKNIKIRKL